MNVQELQSKIFTIIKFSKCRVFPISMDIKAENEGQNFFHARKEGMPLTASIFAKLPTVHWHDVENS
jgi:hypothetical protein